jgi:hypothetical protein
MSVNVVDWFEVVDVDHDGAERPSIPPHFIQLRQDTVLAEASVPNTCHWIHESGSLQAFDLSLKLEGGGIVIENLYSAYNLTFLVFHRSDAGENGNAMAILVMKKHLVLVEASVLHGE